MEKGKFGPCVNLKTGADECLTDEALSFANRVLTLLEITYREGVPHGPYLDYWSNGKLATAGNFQDGKQHGV